VLFELNAGSCSPSVTTLGPGLGIDGAVLRATNGPDGRLLMCRVPITRNHAKAAQVRIDAARVRSTRSIAQARRRRAVSDAQASLFEGASRR
jgi:hypothetical protein